jgi:hypothetical protein
VLVNIGAGLNLAEHLFRKNDVRNKLIAVAVIHKSLFSGLRQCNASDILAVFEMTDRNVNVHVISSIIVVGLLLSTIMILPCLVSFVC